MITLTTTIIAILMALGIIDSSTDLNNLNEQQKTEIQEIIVDDDLGL